jgi:hypothetical protein
LDFSRRRCQGQAPDEPGREEADRPG